MNVIHTRFKSISPIFESLLLFKRGYAVPKKLPVTWIRPEKPTYFSKEVSGDCGLDHKISEDQLVKDFEQSKELKDADEIIKKMFSVGFNHRRAYVEVFKEKTTDLVKRHQYDRLSMEFRIASLTGEILQLQDEVQNNPKNYKLRVFLKEMIEKRKKFLRKLRTQDYARFEFLLERLNLVYHPHVLPEDAMTITRKGCTKKLLQNWCDNLVKQKLENYKKELQAQQKDFYKEKAEKLQFIRNEELACGVTPTVSEEEIEAVKQKVASFV